MIFTGIVLISAIVLVTVIALTHTGEAHVVINVSHVASVENNVYILKGIVTNIGDGTARNVQVAIDNERVHLFRIKNLGALDADESVELDFSFTCDVDFTKWDVTVIWN